MAFPQPAGKVSVPMVAIYPIDAAGKIAAEIVYFDSAIMMKQLGLLPGGVVAKRVAAARDHRSQALPETELPERLCLSCFRSRHGQRRCDCHWQRIWRGRDCLSSGGGRGARVLVLERGRRWTQEQFPRKRTDPWLYDHASPNRHHGWLDVRFFRASAVVQGRVGGGSLCYSSVLLKADAERFQKHWPAEITSAELDPYYDKVAHMLAVQTIPPGQHTQRYKLLQQAAQKTGLAARFQSAPLAVSFHPKWNYDLPDPLNVKHSTSFKNDHGQQQGTCVHLGNCDIGCDVKAKNTLDLNYIPSAQAEGSRGSAAACGPLHRAVPGRVSRRFRPHRRRTARARRRTGRARCGRRRVAGIDGAAAPLPRRISYAAGHQCAARPNWSRNGNFFSLDYHANPDEVQQSIGPTISGFLDLMDGSMDGQRFVIEDDGFPNLLLNAARATKSWFNVAAWVVHGYLRRGLREKSLYRNIMVWLGAGVDGGDGSLRLGRSWLMPWKKNCVWPGTSAAPGR